MKELLDIADPYIAEAIILGISLYGGWLFRYVFRTKQSQESLHKAIHTGVDLLTDELAKHVPGAELADQVVDYTKRSVPDAIKFLKPNEDLLRTMAMAKLTARRHGL